MIRHFLIAFLVLCAAATAAYAADLAYVSSKQTSIYNNASLSSDLVATLEQNEAMEIIGQQGIWLQVKVSTITGWVSRYSVSANKPFQQKVSIFARLKNFFSGDNKRARLTLVSTAGGVRGLTEEESDAIGKTDFRSVKIVESVRLSEAEIDEFVSGNSN